MNQAKQCCAKKKENSTIKRTTLSLNSLSRRSFVVKVRNKIIQHCCDDVTIIHHFSKITPLIVDLYIQILRFGTQISLKIRFSFFSQEMSSEIYLNVRAPFL
jgi:hypothetical protein